ncbi:Ldh family oxidoreductase [Paracoccus sp. 1_MG-2023]|uniref:Ldh family oxidoreductase n=1 Tax=unclassified Paracoccus (in: a-proteobacteria) TaxID=2688777 RepID=UPI001C086AD1|nr:MULTISPECIES: Ldh family oxidoreductase [unclassified Paracoccus (in: a-proteobacteria)]MBU2957889.1 Ldh family oxidoreductase [Paracoccus sp. C2R09]MDO6668918.1 Ldh family oxidoreductase [Paracoccus sp. 1_MG-2023]
MANLTPTEAHDLVVRTLLRCRTAPANAAAVARALVAAEEAGQSGHGLRRLPAYAAQAFSGKVDGMAQPVRNHSRPGALGVDARGGFAYPALDVAVEWLTAAAPRQGIAVAGIANSHHCGVAGVTVQRLADAGLVAMMFANAPAAMAPWGGRRPLFGTNPIAFAAPRPAGKPSIVVDISLSKVARGKVMAADQRNEPIPEGWALDPEGRPTTDAGAALAGTMLPMGDAKGTALALMVELLAAGLVGANFAHEASSFFTAEGPPPGVGQLILAIDPGAFGPGATAHVTGIVRALEGQEQMPRPADALQRFDDLASAVEGDPGARLPGARRTQMRQDVARNGIEIDDALLAQIAAAGSKASVGA